MDSKREAVLEIFRELGHDTEFGDGDSLVQLRILDSLNILELINSLEQHFHFYFDEDDLTLDNFESVGKIIQIVSAKLEE